jgi:hypothetical protein
LTGHLNLAIKFDKMGVGQELIGRLKLAALREAVSVGCDSIITGVEVGDRLKHSLAHVLIDTGAGFAAGKIGTWYGNGDLNFLTHKLAHAGLGAGIGAIQGNALSGALGGILSETIADCAQEDVQKVAHRVHDKAKEQNIAFGSDAYQEMVQQEALKVVNFSKIATAVALTLSSQDLNIGMEVANNALEHNFVPMVMGAIYAAGLALSAYDAYQAYEEEGIVGVGKSVATDVGITILAGGTVKVGSKALKALKTTGISKLSNKKVGIKWGKGIQEQGMPFEDYLAQLLPSDARLPKNFKTFDFYDEATKIATSAKTLDTQTASKLTNPKKVYQSLKKSVDAAAGFKEYALSGKELFSEIITTRKLEVAIPKQTTSQQWGEITKAMTYAKHKGIDMTVTVIK